MAYAVTKAGHDPAYCFHPRQDCESCIYLLLEILHDVLLDRPLFKVKTVKQAPSPRLASTASSTGSKQRPSTSSIKTRSSSRRAAALAESATSPPTSPTDLLVSPFASLGMDNGTRPSLTISHDTPTREQDHELQVPNVDNSNEQIYSSRQPRLSHREDNLKKFDEIMEALVARAKLKARPKSYEIVIEFLGTLQVSRILTTGPLEQLYWQEIARGRRPRPGAQEFCRGENENWLVALQEVIQLLKDTVKQLRDCGESLEVWDDWGELLSAWRLTSTHSLLLQMLQIRTVL